MLIKLLNKKNIIGIIILLGYVKQKLWNFIDQITIKSNYLIAICLYKLNSYKDAL